MYSSQSMVKRQFLQTLSGWVYLTERKHGAKKLLSIETIEKIVKILEKGNPQSRVRKNRCFFFHSKLCLKFVANIKEMGWLKKENITVDDGRHENV